MPASSEVVVEVVLPADLHARPAGQVARALAGLDAAVRLATGARADVDARSVLAVMALGAVAGDVVRIGAEGVDARAAADAVVAVLAAAEAARG